MELLCTSKSVRFDAEQLLASERASAMQRMSTVAERQVSVASSNATPTRLCSSTMAPLQLSQKLPQRASDAPLEYAFSPLC